MLIAVGIADTGAVERRRVAGNAAPLGVAVTAGIVSGRVVVAAIAGLLGILICARNRIEDIGVRRNFRSDIPAIRTNSHVLQLLI